MFVNPSQTTSRKRRVRHPHTLKVRQHVLPSIVCRASLDGHELLGNEAARKHVMAHGNNGVCTTPADL